MREMKDSGIAWIGKIPKEWGIVKFKYLHNGLNTGEAIDKEYWESDAGLNAFYTAGLTPIRTGYSNFPTWKETGENDLLLARNGTPYVYLPVSKAYYTDHIIRAAMSSLVNRRFIRYCLQQSIASIAVDSVSIPTWSATLWNNQILTWPSVIEQERIAAFLDAECAEIDAVLEKTRASIEEYKKLKQAVITQAVTKGIRGDRPMKNSGIEWIGEIPAEWDVLNLVAHTSMLTPMRDRPENLDGPIPWVRIEDFEGKYIESSKAGLGVSMKTVKEMNLKVYPVGTILCTSSCIMGKCAIVSRELVSNQRFIGIIPDRTTDKTYLYYLMTSNAERMNFLSTGALQANLSRSAFEHLKVQFPPYSEQQEIAAYLDDKCEKIDELILKKQQYLTEIENYKKSLIYEYVTGKKEVV